VAAVSAGAAALFAFPLQIGAIRIGVLDLYRHRPGGLAVEELADALVFADTLTLLLLAEHHIDGADLAESVRFEHRVVIHQATGMVLAQTGGTITAAFDRLLAYAYAEERPLADVAVDVVDRQTEHLARLVEDLLEGSRVSARKLELRKQRVELAEIARLAVETSAPLIEAAGHELSVTLPAGSIVVDGDSARLVQALVNLLNNAAKYTPAGGRVSLIVETLGDVVSLTVRDSGIGIATDMLDRVFEMFTRADRSLEREQGGLGIGLAVAKRIVEMHGGSIQARSDGAGKGAEFAVRLPIAEGPSVGAGPARKDLELADRVTPRRILVVDDNRDATDALTILLKTQGHLVRTAYDGIEAVEAAKAHRPEVVLLDLGLPRLNGYEVARAIRALPWGRQAELIAVTGYGQAEDRRLAAQAGFDRHLTKPVQAAQLKAILASMDNRSDE
jgi:signal transduction histidine kinase/ActR/RegA family two-component response regulator